MPHEATTAPQLAAQHERTPLRRWAFLIGAGVFATTLAQPAVQLARLPLQRLLKFDLHQSRASVAVFFAVASIAWNFKPIAGIVSDTFPLFGTRRRYYLILSMLGASCTWLIAGFVPHSYTALLGSMVAINALLVIGSTVTGGLLVQAGQRFGATGRLSSARAAVSSACMLVAGPAGGFLASRAFGAAVSVSALVAFSIVPIAIALLHEPQNARRNMAASRELRAHVRSLFRSGTLWTAAGLLFLVFISPGFATPLYYYQTDTLGFSQQYIGALGMVSGALGLLGAAAYGLLCRRFPLRVLLAMGILCSVVATLLYLDYRSRPTALVVEAVAGFFATLAELPLMDMAARATPRGNEALGFSLMMSVRNGAISLSDVLGSKLADHFHLRFASLVWLNAGTTALVMLVIPLLPAALMRQREGVLT